ncbi:serine protease 38 [Manis pentadactyla]|uniref:serine protease 38 n=1 Tax=Manis pentadactyla TaxID=143292 RepID=UPI00255CF348|nr:serine protease 38 [Manis pentadactyla]
METCSIFMLHQHHQLHRWAIMALQELSLPTSCTQSSGHAGLGTVGRSSDRLQEVQLSLLPGALCQLLYGHTYIQPDMLCAGNLRNVETMCEGDSGGPLVCEFEHIWLQIGVVSWGRGRAYPTYPAVYAQVSYFSKWISYHMEHTPTDLLSPSLPFPPV